MAAPAEEARARSAERDAKQEQEREAARKGGPLWWAGAERGAVRGIRSITPRMVASASAGHGRLGKLRWRLVASAERVPPRRAVAIEGAPGGSGEGAKSGEGETGESDDAVSVWRARVQPELLPETDPLFSLVGASSAVELHTDALAPVTVVSSNPTTQDTAFGLLSDLLTAVKGGSETHGR